MDRPHTARLQKPPRNFIRLIERLLYLPGALVLAYGFWLSLTV